MGTAGALPGRAQFRELVRGPLPFTATAATCFAVADVDGDGDLDLALGRPDGTLQLWLQQSKNTYVDERGRLPAGGPAAVRSLVVADVDRDGDPDFVVFTAAADRLLVNQAGRFRDESSSRLPGLADDSRDGFAFDADRDGDLDLYVASAGQDRLYLNDGLGVFADATAGRLPAENDFAGAAAPLDVDRDGDLDLFVGNHGPDRLLLNDGRGTFSPAPGWSSPPAHTTSDVAIADMDSDGDPDIVIANSYGVGIVRNDRIGFGTGGVEGSGPAQAVAVADLNRDGWPDLLISQLGRTEVVLNLRDPELRFARTSEPLPGVLANARALGLTDLDRDGDADAIVATPDGTAVLFHAGSGSFLAPPITPLLTPPHPAIAVVGDAEGDGDLDVVFARFEVGTSYVDATVHLNDGRGTYGRSQLPLIIGPANAGVLADVDGDRLADLVLACDGPERLLINHGGGVFHHGGSLQPRNDRTLAVAAGDVDADGDVDLVFAGDAHLVLERNSGTGTFAPESIAAARVYTTGLALADLDRDGDLDLVAANFGASAWLFHNNGRGAFVLTPGFAPPPQESRAVAAGDVEGDGDLDLVFANWGQTRLYRNDASGFVDATAMALPPNQDACEAVALGDADGDGDLDLFLGVLGHDRLLLNDGRGAFTVTNNRLATVDSGTRQVVPFDADGDGDLDLLSVALLARPRLLTNLTRQFQPRSYAMTGQWYDGDFFAEPWRFASQTVLPVLGLAPLATPLATPFGRLWLDPAAFVGLRARSTSPLTGMAPLNVPVPDVLAFRSMPLTIQALVLHGTASSTWRLTNAIGDRIAQ